MSAYDNEDQLYLSDVFGSKLARSDKEHEICLWEGPTGFGKSYAAISAMWNTSLYLAYERGRDPEDYFTIDNIAIITPDEVLRVAKAMKFQGIYCLDDIGVGLSSRKWNQKSNEVINNILMTFRTNNNLLTLTVPNKKMIDVNARRLTHHKVVMESKLEDFGISIGKLSTVEYQYHKDSDAAIYPFLKYSGKKYNKCMFEMPPKFLWQEYDKRRKEIEEANREETLAELAEMQSDEEKPSNKKMTKIDAFAPAVMAILDENPNVSIREISRRISTSRDTVSRIFEKYNLHGLSGGGGSNMQSTYTI